MIKIIMHGCNGKMGHAISRLVADDDTCTIAAGIDVNAHTDFDYPVFTSLDACNVDADVIIDFSVAPAVGPLLDSALAKQIPIVVCTTGLDDALVQRIHDVAQELPVLFSANMSLGINLLANLVKKATQILSPAGFDIEIVEKHHNQKLDAPSGTALYLADSANEALDDDYAYRYDRSQVREKRPKKEIGIHAVRGGSIVGEHQVIFAGQDEVIELSHMATSKSVFAVGAVSAAKYLAGKSAGLYDMGHVIE